MLENDQKLLVKCLVLSRYPHYMAYDPRQNSLFDFYIHHLNFYLNFIAEYKIVHSFFRFRIIGKRFYTRLLFFKLNSFIWPLLAVYFQLASSNYTCRVIFQTRPWKFSARLLNFRSRFSDRWSRPFVEGVERPNMTHKLVIVGYVTL